MVKGKYLTRLAVNVMDRQLLHALGCDEKPAVLKGSAKFYAPCRNYYTAASKEPALEEAVKKGYAVCFHDGTTILNPKGFRRTVCYSVTISGVSYLANKYGAHIAINRSVTDVLTDKGKEKAA